MSVRIITWDEGKTRNEIKKRYKNASDARLVHENRWILNEQTLYSTGPSFMGDVSDQLERDVGADQQQADNSNSYANVAYVFKNNRFIHAQMSANPPAVAMRPTSSDQDDHRKADAADRLSRWALRAYQLQEQQDQQNLQCLNYGSGIMKTTWDSTIGDIIGFDEKTGALNLEGDISVSVPFIWNIRVDPDARSWKDVKYIFETIYMDYEEACARWPDKADALKKALVQKGTARISSKHSALQDDYYNCVELVEYWETGLPTNGYLGRFAITLEDGEVIEPCRPSPFRFKRAGAVSQIEDREDLDDSQKEHLISRLPEQARLPYHMLTDIDVPNTVWGRSNVEYAANIQNNLTRLDSAKLDNMRTHGVVRMVVPETCDVQEDAFTDTPLDIVKISGNQPPYFMQPPTLMPDMTTERQNYLSGINDVMGVNESMLGQQSREQSGASMQYATNQGNMIRRRLFNKYVLNVESLYKAILDLIRKHWTVERTIHVLGKEKALEAIDVKGADIDGGYDVIGEYGVTLSLDPVTRREEILQLQPLFKEAGVPARTAMKMLKLNEVEGMFDELEMADLRQKEIFDAMIATRSYIPPKKYRDHLNMIAFAMRYFMTQEFESLDEEVQQLCERHIEERGQLAAQEAPAAPAAPGAPGSPPIPGSTGPSPGPIPSAAAGPVPPPSPGPQPAAG